MFGGVTGFNYFKPPLKHYSYYKPEVYIDEILVNNKQYFENSNANNIQKINLDYAQNDISVHAFVKDLSNAKSRFIIYKIKEIDKEWKHLSNGTPLNFNNLAPNNYTLELGYFDKYSNKEVFQKTISIAISAPFYYKIWFWVLVAFVLSALFFWFYSRRKFEIQKNLFKQQLAIQQERNKITADLHDDIGATLSSLQINSAVANSLLNKNPKETQKVLEKIELQAQNLADKIGDIIWSMKPGKEEFLPLSLRIKNFANDILGSTDIVYSILVDEKIDTTIFDITVRKNCVLMIKEAINNVAKYSKATQLNITLKKIDNVIKISIVDNGIGFEINETSGNGIGNMRRRIEELDGSFKIISVKNEGTSIFASIPCPYI